MTAGSVCDTCSAHYVNEIKKRNANHSLFWWSMVFGGFSPMFQLLNILINKVVKRCFCYLFDLTMDYMLPFFCASFLRIGWSGHGFTPKMTV
jgi:hypothetical protein